MSPAAQTARGSAEACAALAGPLRSKTAPSQRAVVPYGAGIGGSGSGGTVRIDIGAAVTTSGGSSASAVDAGGGITAFESPTNSGALTLDGSGTLVNTETTRLSLAGYVAGVTVTEHDYAVTFRTGTVEMAPAESSVYASSFLTGYVTFPTLPTNYEWMSAASGGVQVTATTHPTKLFGESATGATLVTLYLARTAQAPTITSSNQTTFTVGHMGTPSRSP